jgi:hypothetical protein
MACCKCCCGNAICEEGDEGKCCCGGEGPNGDCCEEGEFCCDGVCEGSPCGCVSDANCPQNIAYAYFVAVEVILPIGCFAGGDGWEFTGNFPGVSGQGWRYRSFLVDLLFCTEQEALEHGQEAYDALNLPCEPVVIGGVPRFFITSDVLRANKCCVDGVCVWCDEDVAAFVAACEDAP